MFRRVKASPVLTARDVERLSLPGKHIELVRGQLVVREPPGTVFAQDTGFKITSEPDTVRAPDVAFVGQGRADRIPDRGYAELAPDLLAEVLSPDDRPPEVLTKIADWLAAGTKVVWLVDPERGRAWSSQLLHPRRRPAEPRWRCR